MPDFKSKADKAARFLFIVYHNGKNYATKLTKSLQTFNNFNHINSSF
jgi:hypothetical protein